MMIQLKSNKLFCSLVNGCRSSLSRAITLVESNKSSQLKRDLVRQAFKYSNTVKPKTIRIAISGAPGAGKSTFIESFGEHLIKNYQRKIAV